MTQKKTLLIIGAGHEQVPAIQIAKSKGHKVWVTDYNPSAPGIQYADHFAEISTADKEANLALAIEAKIDGVMTLGSELAVPVVAHICEKMNLNGVSKETALKATNKNVMHDAFKSFSVPSSESQKIENLIELEAFVEKKNWPIVVKPSDSSGQKGIGIYDESSNLEQALIEAIKYSSDGSAIVEEYVNGPEINVTALVENGRVHFLSFSHRVTAESPHFGIATAHKSPIGLTDAMLLDVKNTALAAIESIGLKNGIAYPQIIASPDKGAKILEIAARIPGGYMREVALLQSGVDMIEVAIDQALDEFKGFKAYQSHPKYKSVIVKFLTELDLPGRQSVSLVSGFEGREDSMEGVFLSDCRLLPEDLIPDLNSSSARFGAVITYGDSIHETESLLERVLSRVVLK
ncbi:ATP-grasp domain-containing protein [Thiomicrorhabdus sp. Milos-T2]|uniref:ATP-binding protein n=1 Tax=Thiomicrorhabdus sp. Milos-T2 TaxID=90814 RepID=UPI000493D255|nr:ATP-grasp domain-containing protein [Thiomicrorhabdus sp. Milos-T2]